MNALGHSETPVQKTTPWVTGATNEPVELSLLLPASQARSLLKLSRQRGQSMAVLLRELISRELATLGDV